MLQNNRVAIVNVVDYSPELVEQKIDEALKLLGGLGQFVQAGEKVLLKPNKMKELSRDYP